VKGKFDQKSEWKLTTFLDPTFHFLFLKKKCIACFKLTSLVNFFGQLSLAFKEQKQLLHKLFL